MTAIKIMRSRKRNDWKKVREPIGHGNEKLLDFVQGLLGFGPFWVLIKHFGAPILANFDALGPLWEPIEQTCEFLTKS